MTAHLTVTYCATCGALETAHEIRANGTRGKRLAMTAGATDSAACPGWVPGRVEERPDEGELRRRLDAVLALHGAVGPYCSHCSDEVVRRGRMTPDGPFVSEGRLVPADCPTVRAARGET